MNLQDLAKSAIDEVAQGKDINLVAQKGANNAFSSNKNATNNPSNNANPTNNAFSNSQNATNSPKNSQNPNQNLQNANLSQSPAKPEVIDFMPSYKSPSELQIGTSYTPNATEAAFLRNVKERILVLFEGLKAAEYDDIETRLDLTINFLEFLLASIEDKLKK